MLTRYPAWNWTLTTTISARFPTFDPSLVGTGLLDKYLFQGFSAGGRVEVLNQIWLSTNLGRSNGTGDANSSLNQMYGITFSRVPLIRLRADAHYAKLQQFVRKR